MENKINSNLLYNRTYAKNFTCIILFDFHSNPTILLLSLIL